MYVNTGGYSMSKKAKAMVALGIVIVILMVLILFGTIIGRAIGGSHRSIDDLAKKVNVTEATPTKGTVVFDNNNLYDELP